MGIAVDGVGAAYVADTGNNQIRKISPTGGVTVIAGSRVPGSSDGDGLTASFRGPFGVAVDGAGNVYVADTGNHLIRRISPDGSVRTLAGTGLAMARDGTGTSAGFSQPEGIAVDGSGNVYVSDTGNNQIRKVTPAGVVTTLAGNFAVRGSADGSGISASFSNPKGLAVDASGNVYVADTNNQSIRKITPLGVVTTLATGLGDVANVAVDNRTGHFYVSLMRGSLLRLAFPGPMTTAVGAPDIVRQLPVFNSAWQTASKPFGIAVDGNGRLYVSDTWNNRVQSIDTGTGSTNVLAGAPSYGSIDASGAAARFNRPRGVVSDSSGNLYVADTGNCSIRKISVSGVVTTFAGSTACGLVDGQGTSARFVEPWGMTIDGSDNLYLTDGNSVRKITPAATVTTVAGSTAEGDSDGTGNSASFRGPRGVVVGPDGNLYVADTENYRIRKIAPNGVVTTLAGTSTFGTLDGTGTAARFDKPSGIVIDSKGNLFVSDYTAERIRKITAGGLVTTFAGGAATTATLIDAVGAAAKFLAPAGLAIDESDNIYVADSYNNSIRKISPAAVVTTLAGSGDLGNLDGAALSASFFNPEALTVGRDGSIFVADTWNDQIRRIAP
ncbi:hypothetical protein WG922_17420 [Ramlibacter sp. AN1015]|uniref:hypothetical protein n=1 Tax=Ramlibacter sp. AN1015 TaxID=3133428 RepID=UPI0030C0BA0F